MSGIAVSVGSAVSLPIELYQTYRGLNRMDKDIMIRIENVTSQLEKLQNQSMQEFETFPDQTIFNLYHRPLRRDSRGTYRLGIEDVPRAEEHPDRMDPLFQDIPGLPAEVEELEENALKTTTTTTGRVKTQYKYKNRTSRLVKGHTSVDETLNATRSPAKPANRLEKGLTGFWGIAQLSLRAIGWIMIAMVGFVTFLLYALLILCVRRGCISICARRQEQEDSPRAIPLSTLSEPVIHPKPVIADFDPSQLDNLSTVNNVYEIVPMSPAILGLEVNPARN